MASYKQGFVGTATHLPPSPPSESEDESIATTNGSANHGLAYKPATFIGQQPHQQTAATQRHGFTNMFQPYAGNQALFVHVPPNQGHSKYEQHHQTVADAPYFTNVNGLQPRRSSTGTFLPAQAQRRAPSPLYRHDTEHAAHSMDTPNSSTTYNDQKTLSGLLAHAYQRVISPSKQQHISSLNLRQASSDEALNTKSSIIPSASTFRYAGLCLLWYISSALSNNSGKSILAHFRYPVTLTMVQFGFVSVYCVMFCALREYASRLAAKQDANAMRGHRSRPSVSAAVARSLSTIGGGAGNAGRYTSFRADGFEAWGIRKPGKQALHGTLIMSVFQIAGHVFSSMAIARVPVSTVHTIKALSPLFTVLSYAFLFRVRYSASTYMSLVPLTLGVMLACSFDMRANAVGLVLALGSTIIFVSQNIFSKKLLPKEADHQPRGLTSSATGTAGRLDKVNLLLYSAGMAFLLMLPIWVYTDLHTLLQPKPTPPNPITTFQLLSLFLLNGSVHFAQCLLAFSILARSSPVAYSIASLIKRVAVIGMAIVWFGQSLRMVQGLGMIMTFVGLFMYNNAKSDISKGERKRGAFETRNDLLLPSTTHEARLLDDPSSFTPEPSPSTTPLPRDLSPSVRQTFGPIRPASPQANASSVPRIHNWQAQHTQSLQTEPRLRSEGLTANARTPPTSVDMRTSLSHH